MGFILRVLINAGALMLAARVVPGIYLAGWQPALLAGLVLGLVNAIIRRESPIRGIARTH